MNPPIGRAWTSRRRNCAACGTRRTSRPVRRVLCPRATKRERRPSISACRRRQALAAYPQASDGPSSIACAGHHLAVAALLALLRVGFTEPPRSPGALVGSYPTVSPLPHL